jgi:spore coat polysaccharide biosynthesis protein SpsF
MILAVLQARMSSTRLPGKVMAPLAGAPMIQRQIERLSRCGLIDELVVATSVDPSDDGLAAFLEARSVNVFRGPLDDVLARFVGAHEAFGPASHIVRLTADCPFADSDVIDDVIDMCLDAQADYASNTPPQRTFPKGLDVEVFTADALALAAADPSPQAREHVTWDMFRRDGLCPAQAFLSQEDDEGEVRWTVDRPDDLEFAAAVYAALHDDRRPFTSDDIRAFVRANPQWAAFGGDRRL